MHKKIIYKLKGCVTELQANAFKGIDSSTDC